MKVLTIAQVNCSVGYELQFVTIFFQPSFPFHNPDKIQIISILQIYDAKSNGSEKIRKVEPFIKFSNVRGASVSLAFSVCIIGFHS